MIFYFLILLFAFLMLVNNKYMRLNYYLLLALLLLLAGFRYNVGTDYSNYEGTYLNQTFWFPEIGFIALVDFLNFLNVPVQGFFLVVAFIIQVLIIKSFNKFSSTKEILLYCLLFYVLLYYYNHSLNLLRQFISMGFFLLSLNAVHEKKFLKYNGLFIIMLLFHQSSFVLYPIYFIYNYVPTILKKTSHIIALLIMSFCLMFLRFDQIILDLLITYGDRFAVYANWGAEQYIQYELSLEMILVLIGKLIITILIVIYRKKFIQSKKEQFLFRLFLLGVLLTFPLYPMLIFRRFLFYINIVEIIIYAIFSSRNFNFRLVLVLFGLLYFFASLLSGFSDPLPFDIRVFD